MTKASLSDNMVDTFICKDVDELLPISASLLSALDKSKIWTFTGTLGAGKTSLIKALCYHLGYMGEVTSPTFSIINEYSTHQDMIYHMDLYRLKSLDEVMDIGMEDYLYSGHYCMIEWPQLLVPILTEDHYQITIQQIENDVRKIQVTFHKFSLDL